MLMNAHDRHAENVDWIEQGRTESGAFACSQISVPSCPRASANRPLSPLALDVPPWRGASSGAQPMLNQGNIGSIRPTIELLSEAAQRVAVPIKRLVLRRAAKRALMELDRHRSAPHNRLLADKTGLTCADFDRLLRELYDNAEPDRSRGLE
jgi:hypothetical protein